MSWLEVDDFGRVHADTLAAAIAENPADVALVTVMWANNEVGTVNPVRELAEVAHVHGIPFHTDAVQAVGQVPVDFTHCGADALTVTGHKIGGPMGAGVLLVRRGTRRWRRCCTAVARSGASGRARWTSPASSDLPSPSRTP